MNIAAPDESTTPEQVSPNLAPLPKPPTPVKAATQPTEAEGEKMTSEADKQEAKEKTPSIESLQEEEEEMSAQELRQSKSLDQEQPLEIYGKVKERICVNRIPIGQTKVESVSSHTRNFHT